MVVKKFVIREEIYEFTRNIKQSFVTLIEMICLMIFHPQCLTQVNHRSEKYRNHRTGFWNKNTVYTSFYVAFMNLYESLACAKFFIN